MTIKDIQMQVDPLRKAAMLHVRFWHTAAWTKARAMRDDLIDEYDPEWPHGRFWDAVDEIHLCEHWKVDWLKCWAANPYTRCESSW